jgi:hypothetical protein
MNSHTIQRGFLTLLCAGGLAASQPGDPCAGEGTLTIGGPLDCAEVTLMLLPTELGPLYTQADLELYHLDAGDLAPAFLEPVWCFHRIVHVYTTEHCLTSPLVDRSPSSSSGSWAFGSHAAGLQGGMRSSADPPNFHGSSYWSIEHEDSTPVMRWDFQAP